MSLFGKFMDSMRLSEGDDDDYFLDDDYEEDEKPSRKSLFGKRDEEYYDDDEDPEETSKPRFLGRSSSSSSKVVPMKKNMEVSMIKPTSMEDSKEICDYLLAGKAVVLNMEGLHTEVAQRIIDFSSGATYSMNGNLQKISNYIFIATPESVELSGDFQDLLGGGSGSLDMSGLNLRL
ncbi:MAG: cell division protein SepF [Hungatella sp.]|jgi:cell division inhibitor SepF|nr:cell division protein SepF [Hungatella sp.]